MKQLKDKDLEFANSIRPIFEPSLCVTSVCNYLSINPLRGQSHKLVSQIKVSVLHSW